MKSLFYLATIAIATTAVFSCKKDKSVANASPELPCSASIYALQGSIAEGASGPYTAKVLNQLNPAVGGTSTGGTANVKLYGSVGVINTDDNCYYLLGNEGMYVNKLYKISLASGAVSSYMYPSDSCYIRGLCYNSYTHQLLTIKKGSVDSLAAITTGATSFSCLGLASLTGNGVYDFSTDPNTGNTYYTNYNTAAHSFRVGKVVPGAISGTAVTADISGSLFGMHYNSADNMLYGIYWNGIDTTTMAYMLANIAPASGAITQLNTLGVEVNGDFYSTCIDACHNKYIISSMAHSTTGAEWIEDSSSVYQFNMSGTLVQHNNVAGIYSGIDVKY